MKKQKQATLKTQVQQQIAALIRKEVIGVVLNRTGVCKIESQIYQQEQEKLQQ